MIPRALWAAPVAVIVVLAGWTLRDLLPIAGSRTGEAFLALLALGLALLSVGHRFVLPASRRVGILLLALAYVGTHVVALPIDPATALGFVTLVLVYLGLRLTAERFAPLYRMDLAVEERERITAALVHSLVRLAIVSGTTFFVSILAADLAVAGTIPVTTIPTALLLAVVLILVVFLLALWPTVSPRRD